MNEGEAPFFFFFHYLGWLITRMESGFKLRGPKNSLFKNVKKLEY